MIAEEEGIQNPIPKIDLKADTILNFIKSAIENSVDSFKKAMKQGNLIKPLNENKLTQIYVEQIEVIIKSHPQIGVKNQYSDLFLGTKGIPDFYFHIVEEGVVHKPLYVVEAKRLPSPIYDKEYVIGLNNNGGIERFKRGKHGQGLNKCGMMGFIEDKDFKFWLKQINLWIAQEVKANPSEWSNTEILKREKSDINFCTFKSTVKRKALQDLRLSHSWIKI
jgi:hypothetical protein